MLTSSAGIGGSEISIPLIKFFFGFDSHDTVPLAQFGIFICCLTRFILRFGKKHPLKPEAVEIDYTIGMVLLPPIIFGASIGVIIYKYLPKPVISLLLLFLIIFAAGKSYLKAKSLYQKESSEQTLEKKVEKEDALSNASTSINTPLHDSAEDFEAMSSFNNVEYDFNEGSHF